MEKKFEQKIQGKNGFKEKKPDKDKVISLDEMFSDNKKMYGRLQEMIDQNLAIPEKEKNERGEIITITIKEKESGRVLLYQDVKRIRDALMNKEETVH